MKKITTTLGLALVLSGCAMTHKGRAVATVVASDGVADEVAEQWDERAHARIDKCREAELPDEDARRECLGVFALIKDELEAIVASLVAAQSAIKLAVECEDNPLKMPQEALKNCGTAKQTDWRELEAQVMDAVDAIRPLIQEIRRAQ